MPKVRDENGNRGLTEREEAFCQNKALGKNGTESAKLAKYGQKSSPMQACRLLKRDDICQRIRELKAMNLVRYQQKAANLLEKRDLAALETIPKVVQDIRKVVEECLHAKGKKLMAALKGLDMLARHVGAYEADNQQQAFTLIIERPCSVQPVIEAEVIETRALPAGVVGVPIPGPVDLLAALDLPVIERAN